MSLPPIAWIVIVGAIGWFIVLPVALALADVWRNWRAYRGEYFDVDRDTWGRRR